MLRKQRKQCERERERRTGGLGGLADDDCDVLSAAPTF